MTLGAGDQIVADAVILEGNVQVNESLITGEARAVPKAPGGELRSGSFLMAGHCTARLTKVGAESYASRLTAAAQADGHKVAKGEMMRSLDRLIQAIGLGLVPVGALLFWKQYVVLSIDLRSSVESVVAALIGMIPEGLYLLTSVALAVGMLRLARRKVLTQDMNCIETLARVDVLCVDKTGTITESAMQADAPVPLGTQPLETLLRSFYAGEEPDNDTGRALKARFGGKGPVWPVTGQIPFNTAYKYSAKTFGMQGSYVVGRTGRTGRCTQPRIPGTVGPAAGRRTPGIAAGPLWGYAARPARPAGSGKTGISGPVAAAKPYPGECL